MAFDAYDKLSQKLLENLLLAVSFEQAAQYIFAVYKEFIPAKAFICYMVSHRYAQATMLATAGEIKESVLAISEETAIAQLTRDERQRYAFLSGLNHKEND